MNDRTLPHDAALPQLARALDASAMARTFATALRGDMRLAGCAIDRVKYRPQRSCSVSYRLQLRDARSGHPFEQHVGARFLRGGEAARRHGVALQGALVPSAAGPALQHDAALDMLAYWLPNDPKLGVLRLLADAPALRAQALDDVAATLGGVHAGHDTTLTQVVPELRACARVELRLRDGSRHTLYAKADLERNGATMHALLQALARSPAQARGWLRTPQPVLWQPQTGLHWQRAVPGVSLLDAEAPLGPSLSARIGRQLAALHAVPVVGVAMTDVSSLLADLRRAGDELARVEPAWQPLIERIGARLAAGAGALAAEPVATLHGDLHPGNLLLCGERLGVIDLDSVQRGPAVLELGAWAAQTLARALLDGTPPARAARAWQAFVAAYADAAGRQPDPALVAWCCAHQLLCRRAWGGLATLKPGRLANVPRLLALADAIAERGRVDAAWLTHREAA